MADIERDGIVARVHILDISAEGAKAHTPIAPGTHQAVTLIWQEARLPGKVIWAEGRRFGIAFDDAVAPDIVTQMLG